MGDAASRTEHDGGDGSRSKARADEVLLGRRNGIRFRQRFTANLSLYRLHFTPRLLQGLSGGTRIPGKAAQSLMSGYKSKLMAVLGIPDSLFMRLAL